MSWRSRTQGKKKNSPKQRVIINLVAYEYILRIKITSNSWLSLRFAGDFYQDKKSKKDPTEVRSHISDVYIFINNN